MQPNTAAGRATVSVGGWALPAAAERSGTVAAIEKMRLSQLFKSTRITLIYKLSDEK